MRYSDKPKPIELPSLATRIEWFEDWESQTSEAQKLARRDRAYYDNDQWTREEVEALQERHQPVLTKNRIARKVNFILGEEIRKRVDPVARPRTPQHEDSARTATDALRYVEEEQEFDKVRSAVLKNALIEGYGGAIKELEQDEDGEVKHCLRHVEWDRLFYDPHSRAPDFGDAKYIGIVSWMDLDDALEAYPDSSDDIRAAIAKDMSATTETTEDAPRRWVDRRRQRVKICEMYFRSGRDWYRADFTQCSDLTAPERTSYLDEKGRRSVCPLVMMSCYVDADGMRYGVVRQLISPQDEINKRSSKALHLLSVRQVIAEQDAVRDPQRFQGELAKPDGYAEVMPGALQEGRIQVTQTGDLAAGQVQLLSVAQADIDSIGPSSATLPDMPQSASGRAFLARQQAASQELGPIFDQLRSWTHAIFCLDWLCIRQYWTEEKWLRVTDDQEHTGYRFVAINQHMSRAERFGELVQKQTPLPQALDAAAGEFAPVVMRDVQMQHQAMAAQMGPQGPALEQHIAQMVMSHPLMQQPITVNQVEHMLVDIVIDEAPETAVLADEQFSTMAELTQPVLAANPALAPLWIKAMIKASSLPNKREIIESFDKGPDPQTAQQQAQAAQMQQAMAQASVQVAQTKAQLQQAQTAKTQAEAQTIPAKAQAEAAHKATSAQTERARLMLDAHEAQASRADSRAEMAVQQMSGYAPQQGSVTDGFS